jgi:tetratricopeptide (TPR) repeat protein
MYDLALCYQFNGRLFEAIPQFEEALKLGKAKHGLDNRDTLESMFCLAWAYATAGRSDEATLLNEDVLRLRKAGLGPDDPDTLHSMFGLAVAYKGNTRLFEAIPLFEEALRLRKAKRGPDHPDTLQSMWGLASTYLDADRLDDAIRRSDEALELHKSKYGPDHPETLAIRAVRAGALGEKLLQQKKYVEAEPQLREGLTSRKGVMPNYWQRFHTESLLGASLLGQKKYGDAEPLLKEGYEGMYKRADKIPAPLKHHLTEAGEWVVRLYDEWGKPEEAAKWRAKLALVLPVQNNETKP